MKFPMGTLAFLQNSSIEPLKETHLYTLEQYETSLHALQAIFPGLSQTMYFPAWTLAHGRVTGGGYFGDKEFFNIFCIKDWNSAGPKLSISLGDV
jgi:hypothetical protein